MQGDFAFMVVTF